MKQNEYYQMFALEDSHFWYRGMRAITEILIKQFLPNKKSLKILDAGCGTGASMIWLARFGTVSGFDISPKAISFCKKRGLGSATLGSLENIPFNSNSFDLIVCLDVLYHKKVASEKKALEELYRALKPGGLVIIRVPAYNWLYSSHDRAVETRHRYTSMELKALLNRQEFAIKKVTYANMFLFPLALIVRAINKLPILNIKKSDVKPLPSFLNKLLYLPMFIESKLIPFFNLPFGLSVIIVGQKPS